MLPSHRASSVWRERRWGNREIESGSLTVVDLKKTLLLSLESCSLFIFSEPPSLRGWGYSSVWEGLASMHRILGSLSQHLKTNKQTNKIKHEI